MESIVVGARESPFRMVPVTEALTTVLQAVETMTQRHVMIASEQANGLVGARAVRATDPFPPFAASIMVRRASRATRGVLRGAAQ